MGKLIDFNHLKEVKSNYFKHFCLAFYLSFLMFLSAITGFIHAVLPFVFPLTPYNLAKKAITEAEEYFIKNIKK